MDDAGSSGTRCHHLHLFPDSETYRFFRPGTYRIQGFLYYLTPNLEGLTVQRFLQILLDAMSQLFFSLSVSMGIMITYGSYVKPDVNLNKAVNQIEIFDTGVAFLAGAMIILLYSYFPEQKEWEPVQALCLFLSQKSLQPWEKQAYL